MKTQDRKNNSFHVRVYDDDLLTSIYEMAALKEFSSMNELMSEALRIGIEKMYIERGKRKRFPTSSTSLASSEEILSKVKAANVTLDDVFVMMTCVEMLMSTLYNVELSKQKGEQISSELMESGYLSDLPEHIKRVKDSLVKRLTDKE